MNNMACKGLVLTKEAWEKGTSLVIANKNTDPKDLVQTSTMSWVSLDDLDLATKYAKALLKPDEDAAVAACRGWYDEKNWGKPYCCQQVEYGSSVKAYQIEVVDASETVEAVAFKSGSVNYAFNAQAFDGAQALASGIAVIASALAFMN